MVYELGLLGEQPHWPQPGTAALWIALSEEHADLEVHPGDSVLVYLDGTILLRRELDGTDILEIADGNPYSVIQLNVHGCSVIRNWVARPQLRKGDQVWHARGRVPVATRRLKGEKVAIPLLRLLARDNLDLYHIEGKEKHSFAKVRAEAEILLRALRPVSLVTTEMTRRPGAQRGAAWYLARGRPVPPLTSS